MADAYIGEIRAFTFNFCPVGWEPCNGQQVLIQQNNVLYAVIGATYGGDGRTTFALPNLIGASPLPNMKYYIATQGIYPQRQ